MISQETVLHASIHDEGGNIRQRLAQHLAETNQWVMLLQARFLATDPGNGAQIDLHAIGDALRQRRDETESLHQAIDQHRRRSEQLQLALDAATVEQTELHDKISQLQPLADNAGLIESKLCQREEELHQAYGELKRQQHDAEALEGEIEKLRAKLNEADKWIFRLAGERRDSEHALVAAQARVADAEKIAMAQQAQAQRHADALVLRDRRLAEQRLEIDRLGKALDVTLNELEAVSRHGDEQQDSYATCIYPLSLEIRQLADGKRLVEHQRWCAEPEAQRLVQEVCLLTRLLYATRERAEQLETDRSSLLAESAKATALSKDLQASRETQEKLAGLLAELQAYGDKLEGKAVEDQKVREAIEARFDQEVAYRAWMVRLSEVLMQRRPFWWYLAPSGWRSKRTHAALRRRGIFDADKYCAMYPDVPAAGMDPLEHYVKHGMREGRSCPL